MDELKEVLECKLRELSTLMYNYLPHDGEHWIKFQELSNIIYKLTEVPDRMYVIRYSGNAQDNVENG